MDIFKLMRNTDTHEVIFFEEPSVSLKGIMAINNTVLGPALATCRIYNFGNAEEAAETVLKMANYNTYRAALLHRGFGGGGIVLCGDPRKVKNEMYFRALGIIINKLKGKLFLVRSAGISHKDMLDIKRESDFLLGIDEKYLQTGNSPAEAIVKGMIWGLKAIVKHKFGSDSLDNLNIVVQGVGEVGGRLVKKLLNDFSNVSVTITDIIYDKIKEIKDEYPDVQVVKPNEIYYQKSDIFISCAFNNRIEKENLEQLDTKILTSSVNELFPLEYEEILTKKGILYVPGFIINGGEIIQLQNEKLGNPPELVDKELQEIFYITWDLLEKAKEKGLPVSQIALETAKNYINQVATIKQLK